jgi:hypothetical protein
VYFQITVQVRQDCSECHRAKTTVIGLDNDIYREGLKGERNRGFEDDTSGGGAKGTVDLYCRLNGYLGPVQLALKNLGSRAQ